MKTSEYFRASYSEKAFYKFWRKYGQAYNDQALDEAIENMHEAIRVYQNAKDRLIETVCALEQTKGAVAKAKMKSLQAQGCTPGRKFTAGGDQRYYVVRLLRIGEVVTVIGRAEGGDGADFSFHADRITLVS